MALGCLKRQISWHVIRAAAAGDQAIRDVASDLAITQCLCAVLFLLACLPIPLVISPLSDATAACLCSLDGAVFLATKALSYSTANRQGTSTAALLSTPCRVPRWYQTSPFWCYVVVSADTCYAPHLSILIVLVRD